MPSRGGGSGVDDAYPNRARPCEGKFTKNGDFITVSGRRVTGPLCKVCGGLVSQDKCLACGQKQGGR